jgi:hypothetical protein
MQINTTTTSRSIVGGSSLPRVSAAAARAATCSYFEWCAQESFGWIEER